RSCPIVMRVSHFNSEGHIIHLPRNKCHPSTPGKESRGETCILKLHLPVPDPGTHATLLATNFPTSLSGLLHSHKLSPPVLSVVSVLNVVARNTDRGPLGVLR